MRAGEHRGSSGMATIASTVMVLLVLAGCGAWRPSGSVQIAAAPNPSATASATPDEAGTPVAALRRLYAVVDRLDGSVTGYLGGRGFPYDPTDLGPAVPLPGGFASVFRYLASVGYRGFEFYSFNQGANGAITMEQLRSALDRAGLVAAGSHTGGLQSMIDPAYRQTEIDRARVLGYRMIGTPSVFISLITSLLNPLASASGESGS